MEWLRFYWKSGTLEKSVPRRKEMKVKSSLKAGQSSAAILD
jgi:hypothetical protein